MHNGRKYESLKLLHVYSSKRKSSGQREKEREGEGEVVDSVAWTTLLDINVAATRLGE